MCDLGHQWTCHFSSICLTVRTGDALAVKVLLDRGASAVEACGVLPGVGEGAAPRPVPPLSWAVSHARADATRVLLAHGASPTCCIREGGDTCVAALCFFGSPLLYTLSELHDTVLALLEAGADPTGSAPPPMPLSPGRTFMRVKLQGLLSCRTKCTLMNWRLTPRCLT
jgi:hypothetical protein